MGLFLFFSHSLQYQSGLLVQVKAPGKAEDESSKIELVICTTTQKCQIFWSMLAMKIGGSEILSKISMLISFY